MNIAVMADIHSNHTGINDWKNISEKYWDKALAEMNVPD